jgi:hypothetical protein
MKRRDAGEMRVEGDEVGSRRDRTPLKPRSRERIIPGMRTSYLAALAATVLVTACTSSSEKGPEFPSSANRTSYAVRYNDDLTASVKAFGDAQERQKALTKGFVAHVDEVKKTDWDKVKVIVDDSDGAGKSGDYANTRAETEAVKHFWDDEKNDITAKVAGGAQHVNKQAGCTAEVGGAVSFALNDALTKQLQKRLRARNEAFLVMDRYKTALGPQNIAALEKLADEVSEASYDVHVAMIVERNKIKHIATDKDEVKKTLERFIQEENAYQAEAGRTDAEKKASAERVAAATKSKESIDSVAAQAENITKEADKAIDASTKEYSDALTALRAKIDERKKAEAPADKPKTTTALRSSALGGGG